MKQFLICATVIAGLFCLPALVEWGAHHPLLLGGIAFGLACVLMAVLGPAADYLGDRQ